MYWVIEVSNVYGPNYDTNYSDNLQRKYLHNNLI